MLLRIDVALPVIQIFILARLYSALLPQTPGRMAERRLAKPPHGTLTPARFSRGRPHCVFPHPWGAVTGQKYHCRRQSRREAARPGPLSSLDGNRSRPLGRSWRIRWAACPLREPCRLRYSDIRICSFQVSMRGFEIPPHLYAASRGWLRTTIFQNPKIFFNSARIRFFRLLIPFWDRPSFSAH